MPDSQIITLISHNTSFHSSQVLFSLQNTFTNIIYTLASRVKGSPESSGISDHSGTEVKLELAKMEIGSRQADEAQ